jgi:ABC-2 type transport system permease protein
MRGTIAIAKKELRSYFFSPVAYLICGVFLFIMGVIFAKFVSLYHQYNMAQKFGGAQGITLDKLAMYLYQNMAFFLIFIPPLITMRLFAEEKRQQTLELLLTAPVRTYEVVLGKFFAACTLMAMIILMTGIYSVFMVMWGNPEVGLILSTYAALFLSMACYIALGTFVSSLFSSQAIAALFTLVALILLWLFQSFGQGITATTGPIEWGPLMVYLAPLGHMTSFSEGLVQMKSVVYFVSFTCIFLFLTHRVVESHRWR